MTKQEKVNLIKAAHAGGAVLKKYFGKNLASTAKSNSADLKTKADTESEHAILSILKKEFPPYNIQSEEIGRICAETKALHHRHGSLWRRSSLSKNV